MLKDFGMEEPHSVMEPQGTASLEAIGSNSPVPAGNSTLVLQLISLVFSAFFHCRRLGKKR